MLLSLNRGLVKFIILSLIFSFNVQAVVLSVIGPCDKKPIISEVVTGTFSHVGELTIHFLTKNKIPFVGTEQGIHRIYNTPVGDAALEVLSDTEMRAYGWCYYVDKLESAVYADEFPLDDTVKKVEWIYGFAHYKNGEWLSTCRPAFTVKPSFLCGQKD